MPGGVGGRSRKASSYPDTAVRPWNQINFAEMRPEGPPPISVPQIAFIVINFRLVEKQRCVQVNVIVHSTGTEQSGILVSHYAANISVKRLVPIVTNPRLAFVPCSR